MSSVSNISTPTLSVGSDGSVTAGNLVNNLDTTSIINALMTAAAVPQTELQAKVKTEQASLTDYQTLNQSIQALATAAQNDTASKALNLLTAASSDPSVTATADTSATASQLSMQVDQIAQSQISVSAQLGTWADASGNITIVDASGASTQITAASTSISDVVSAINAANAGVTASAISVGSDSSGNPLYRLQLTASASGAAGAFQVYAGSSADVSAGTATNVLTQTGAATISSAQDAKVTLWPGTAAAEDITSSSNTFTDLTPGLTVNVTAPTSGAVTITTTQDSSDIANLASTLVSSITSILQYIAQQQAGTTTTNTDGSTSFTAGAFTGDSTIRDVAASLQQALASPVGTNISPSTYGINIQEDGTVTFDQATFQSALSSDPTGTLSALQTITQRVSDAATEASDPYTGSLTSTIQSQQTQITTDQTSITNWTSILSDKKATLTTEYSNLVNTLSQLQTEQQYLTQQITMMDNQNNNN